MRADALDGGFADMPVQAARVFRAAMTAMARPGRITEVEGAAPPPPLSPAAGALILTLCDPETPLHLAGAHDTPAVRDWIAFHAGAPAAPRERAHFAVGTWEALLPLDGYRIGTPEFPDRSATLIVDMDRLESGGVTLRGPGIRGTATLNLPAVAPFVANAARFPLGLDFYFCAGQRLSALPRSTTVEG